MTDHLSRGQGGDEVTQALVLTAAALEAAVAAGHVHPQAKLRLTGAWAHLGTYTVREILDRANTALTTRK